ncbi:MAG TPA: ferritin family protein [Bacteroidales bacterium]|nr:ferritin family protein [Bacteroidales bacterium]HPI30612.1 ferritin family protein [Bacteroidales bacterium]HQN17082.1 ferritin family protein [Bacteroidales bacterium]HQP16620.1 ferritin family protein [Bacteroidales bacterium]
MIEFKTVDEILDFAITAEQEAVEFYTKLADSTTNSQMKTVFEEFAQEEMAHKARLLDVKQTGLLESSKEKVLDMKVADYIARVNVSSEMMYSDALVVAMKKEKAAFKLYMALSERAANTEMKSLFLSLAQEESRHKLRFELEYDEYVLRDN